jgi:putative transposase
MTELRNRGVCDVLIVCCDGLSGLPEAIAAIWPQAAIQTCAVHLICNCMRYASGKDHKIIGAAIRPIYTAATVEAAELALDEFANSELGRRSPAAVAAWRRAWEGSCHSWTIHPRSAGWSTAPTRSSRSTTSCGR